MHTKKKIKRSSKTKKLHTNFLLASDVFNKLIVNKTVLKNDKEIYRIICKKYNDILDNRKFHIVHFLLYCIMRFTDWDYRDIIEKYITFPIYFPININLHTNYNSFNSLLYLNNFIYHLLETNQTLETFIKESAINRVGYNISINTINNKHYYMIYYVINIKKLEISKILFSNTYSVVAVNNYIVKVKEFILNNIQQLIDKQYLTSIFIFNIKHKINYKNKYINSNGLYIPKCHLELDTNYDNYLLNYLLYKEILWRTSANISQYIDVFKKYRNIEKLENDLINTHVSKDDFNNMIRSIKPLGFKTTKLYREFMHDFSKIISTKIQNFIIKIYGSSTLFYSANPKKQDGMFSYKDSDFDIVIIPTQNMEQYKPELEYLVSKTYDINMGLYITPIVCEFFGTDILNPFFKKWGPCSFSEPTDAEYTTIDDINIETTILQRYISPFLSKLSMYYYFDILTQNKTCSPNFSMFITNGNTISYWDHNDKYITDKL